MDRSRELSPRWPAHTLHTGAKDARARSCSIRTSGGRSPLLPRKCLLVHVHSQNLCVRASHVTSKNCLGAPAAVAVGCDEGRRAYRRTPTLRERSTSSSRKTPGDTASAIARRRGQDERNSSRTLQARPCLESHVALSDPGPRAACPVHHKHDQQHQLHDPESRCQRLIDVLHELRTPQRGARA